ncbi:MAG TPA: transcription antitermination factor NusB [Bacillota bacterium]|nr:transcription antitermination factor NusB [Bacillota bacterium]
MNRRTAREKAMQILFQLNMNDTSIEDAIHLFLEEQPVNQYLQTVVEGVNNYQTPIDKKIEQHLENWTIDRIAMVERTILRIAVYELMYEDVPVSVSINEAVELAKKFGDEKSGPFVNGVLSKINAEE